jgi:hypothetical protein
LRRRDSRLDIKHDVVSPRQICAHPTPKSNSAYYNARGATAGIPPKANRKTQINLGRDTYR